MLSKKVLVAAACLATLVAVALVLLRSPMFVNTRTASLSRFVPARAVSGDPNVHPRQQRATTPPGASEKNSGGRADWGARFRNSSDYYDFVSEAAKRAYEGDGRAAYYVGEVVAKCVLIVRTYKDSPDPEGQFNAEKEANSRIPQWIRDKQHREFSKCIRLAKEDAFIALPKRAGGYFTSMYWYGLSLDDKDPLGESRAAVIDLFKADNGNGTAADKTDKAGAVRQAEGYLRDAVSSNDPDVLFTVGMTLANPRYSADPTRGLAIAVAACELGYDCSAQNPANSFSVCKYNAACPADADFLYYLQQTMSPDSYAKMYARAQDFKELLSRGDATALEPFTKIDGAML